MTEHGRRSDFHLAAQFPRGRFDFESCTRMARIAERGLFDFVLLADVPQPLPVLAALSAVTERVGLVGTVDTASSQPFEVARQFATLDHLCDGRVGWNVTDSDYRRADEFLTVADAFWGSWAPDAVVADAAAGVYAQPDRIRTVEHHGDWFDVRGVATLPAGPQTRPVLLHVAGSAGDADFGARCVDVVVTSQPADLKARAGAHGRAPDAVLTLATVTFGGATVDRVVVDVELHVASDDCDGVLLVPNPGLRGLAEFDELVGRIVPLLQGRRCFRDRYDAFTLREHLGL